MQQPENRQAGGGEDEQVKEGGAFHPLASGRRESGQFGHGIAVGKIVGQRDVLANPVPELGEVLVDVAGKAIGDEAAGFGGAP